MTLQHPAVRGRKRDPVVPDSSRLTLNPDNLSRRTAHVILSGCECGEMFYKRRRSPERSAFAAVRGRAEVMVAFELSMSGNPPTVFPDNQEPWVIGAG